MQYDSDDNPIQLQDSISEHSSSEPEEEILDYTSRKKPRFKNLSRSSTSANLHVERKGSKEKALEDSGSDARAGLDLGAESSDLAKTVSSKNMRKSKSMGLLDLDEFEFENFDRKLPEVKPENKKRIVKKFMQADDGRGGMGQGGKKELVARWGKKG